MKRINNFINKGPLWQVFLVFAFLTFCIFFAMEYFLTEVIAISVVIKISLIVGVIFGLMFTFLTQIGRNSIKFWDAAKILDENVEKANSKEQIEDLYRNDFMKLKKLAGGEPHFSELKRLHAIISTKYKLVK